MTLEPDYMKKELQRCSMKKVLLEISLYEKRDSGAGVFL